MEQNSFFNPEIVSDLPSMASSLVGSDGKNRLFLLLWDLPFEKKTLYYSNLLKVVGTLIYNATVRSTRYLDALEHKRMIPDTQLLNKEAFAEMMGVYQRVRDMGLAQFSVLKIKYDKSTSKKEMDRKIHRCVRQTDIVGMLKKKTIGVILPNSSMEDGEIVKARLRAAGITASTFELTTITVNGSEPQTVVLGSGVPYRESLRDLSRQLEPGAPGGNAA